MPQIQCKIPSGQVIGDAAVSVITWNPDAHNATDKTFWQRSDEMTPYSILLECPTNYYGRINEVRCGRPRWLTQDM